MHPAYSIIVFTVASGAGYGLMVWLGLLAFFEKSPTSTLAIPVALGIALLLATGGLLSSTAHLGRPERAWRALSQWRSSWLSREGIAALVTMAAAGTFALAWLLRAGGGPWLAMSGIFMAVAAIATVSATAMIYASLKPVREWHNRLTLPIYVAFALMTGAIVLNALMKAFGVDSDTIALLGFASIVATWLLKYTAWTRQDRLGQGVTTAQAIGLGQQGEASSIEWPHSARNFLLKEMGYRIARKRGHRLRSIVHVSAFGIPALLLLLSMATNMAGTIAALACPVFAITGTLVERWLFFAEATHTVSAYYGLSDRG